MRERKERGEGKVREEREENASVPDGGQTGEEKKTIRANYTKLEGKKERRNRGKGEGKGDDGR